MPKSLKEIKHFNVGTVINTSEQDVTDNAPSFSLNIDPLSEEGVLNSINNDRISFSSDNTLTKCLYPVTWGSDNQFSSADTGYNTSSVIIPDISVFGDNDDIGDINVIGTKGRLERLKVSGISPWWEHQRLDNTNNMTWRVGYGTSGISSIDGSFTYLSDTNNITESVTNFAVTGFTNGEGSITITGNLNPTETFVIITPDGKSITYEVDTDGTPANGALKGSNTCVQLNGALGNTSNIATRVKEAIENTTYGHGGRISITQASNVLNLVYTQPTMDEVLFEGSYFTLNSPGATFNASNQEIIKVISHDSANRTFYVKRNILGSPISSYTATDDYELWVNKLTIDGRQLPTKRGVLVLSDWSKYSGNNIGGTGLWINKADNDTDKARIGKIVSSAKNVVFSASNKTITLNTFTGGTVKINEGDLITFYYGADGEDEPNNGKSFTVLKKEIVAGGGSYTITLHVDTAPADDTESSDIVYFETGLIKNNTFHHSSDEVNPTVEVGSSQTYKVNNWVSKNYSYGAGGGEVQPSVSNLYNDSTLTLISRVNTGGYWEDTTADHGADNAANYYPFDSNDAYISIESEYKDTGLNLSSSCAITDDSLAVGDRTRFGVNDIIRVGTGGSEEYMKITSMTQNKLNVERAILGTSRAAHGTIDVYKSINPSISQTISKDLLKSGQPYILTFHAKDLYISTTLGYGAVSVRFNGGYLNSNGNWVEPSKDSNLGYIQNPEKVAQEDRWIDFKDLEKVNEDTAYNADGTESDSHLDTTWRRFKLEIYPPNGIEFLTDMEIEFASRGKDGTKIGIDLVDLSELTYICPASDNSEISSVGSIDNSGRKNLVLYDNKTESLKVLEDFKEDSNKTFNVNEDIEKSPYASNKLKSKSNKASFISKNRETHIGFGPNTDDSKPQWLGYLNNKVFGTDSSNLLYQDEDTIHSYNDSGLTTMSKITLAGEHENLTGTWTSSSNQLSIAHTGHNMQVGNNIVIRQYQDIDNSWDGNGVWVVTVRTSDDAFVCERIALKDDNPSGGDATFKISYRPYYYYGIKDGDNHLYRIIPDDVYTTVAAASTTYVKGTIEKSLSLPYTTASISTYYNKDTTSGLEGGRVYVLTNDGIIKVINVELKYDEWSRVLISELSSLDLKYKSYIWSNDNVNGNINGDTPVFVETGGGDTLLAENNSPDIEPSGIISDIIETKSPNKDFVHASASANDLDHFDTRLWVQFRPTSGESFTTADRFLFCGLTNSTIISNSGSLYLGDRTPPTTMLFGKNCRWDESESFFSAGPGLWHPDHAENMGDLDTELTRYHSLYNFYRYDSAHKNKINKIGVKTKQFDNVGIFEEYSTVQSYSSNGWNYIKTQEVNFGNNVGFNATGGEIPSIKVAKYGLFPMGDNNCDGVIDGTGLIVPSTTSLSDTLTGRNQNLGPYGFEHEQVCGHAVGVIGGSESPWIRDWGALDGQSIIGNGKYYSGGRGGAPEDMSLEKCVFICSDVHFGDRSIVKASYLTVTGFTAETWGGISGSATLVTLSVPSFNDWPTMGLKPGDTIYITSDSGSNVDGAYTILKINSKNTFTINMNHNSDVTGKAYPHTVRLHNPAGSNTSGNFVSIIKHAVSGVYQHFHYAFNMNGPLDSSIFTDMSKGGGHYSKTWFTTPETFPYNTLDTTYRKPGLLHKVERLNYRAGYMIKPFDLDDNTFESLIVGDNISIDAPVRPEAIYHKQNSSKLHDNQGGNTNNQFATKIFISSPTGETYEEKSKTKVFICDPTFEYPDILHQIEIQRAQTGSTNQWNANGSFSGQPDWKSYRPYLMGKIASHSNTPAATPPTKVNAANCPFITIAPADCVDEYSLLSASTIFRESNRFAGSMLSIVDQDTGTIQTRYIVSSDTAGTSASDDLFLAVHFPFGRTPQDDDMFYIWSHKNACTSSMRLFKEKVLEDLYYASGSETFPTTIFKQDPVIAKSIYKTSGDINTIDGDTTTLSVTTDENHNLSTNDIIEVSLTANYNDLGPLAITVTGPKTFTASVNADFPSQSNAGIWTLVEAYDSDSGVSNPAKVSIDSALNKTLYGGLDMRKSRALTTEGSDGSDGSAVASELIITSNAHFLNTGDTITFNGNTAAHDGIYEITDKTTNNFDVLNPDTTDDTTASQPIEINQWESFLIAGASEGKLAEIRAGLNKWDTGNSSGNLLRKDNNTASDNDLYLLISESGLKITTPSIGDEPNDYFLKDTEYQYKVSLIYDGYQEGPLSTSTWSFEDTIKTRAKLNIQISVAEHSKRLSHVCLYRRDSKDSFYKLVSQISTASGWNYDGTAHNFTINDTGATSGSYEARTGRSEILYNINLKYGISAEIDGYLFAGNCSHENIKNASNQIFRSKPGMYSVFDFSTDFLQLKSKPTALVNFAGRLFAFDNSNIYKINQENLVIEDIYEGIGCLGKDSVIVTEYGMFFADKNGAYMHNGTNPTKISTQIERGGESSETWGGTDVIKNISWQTLVGTSLSSTPYVIFDSIMGSVLFFANYIDYNSDKELPIRINYCWSYNIVKNRWDLWEVSEDTFVGTPFIGDKSSVFIPVDNAVYKYKGGSSKRDYTWLSKKLTMEEDSVVKVYNKVKINGLTSNLNLGGDNKESSDRLLIKTSTGDLTSSNISYSESDTQNSQYKLKGSNKKGRWLQFKMEDMTKPVESIGIIYRRKSTK